MAGGAKKADEDNAGKSQQPVGRTGATATARDSSVNATLPGGARPPMASFPRPAAAAASSRMNYNVQQSVTNAIPGNGQTGHQHGDALGRQQQQGYNADTNAAAWARHRQASNANAAAANVKRQRLEQQENFGIGYGQQRDARGESTDRRMSGSFTQSSSAAPRTLIVLDREPQPLLDTPPTAIPSHGQTGHQHALGQQQRRNAVAAAAATPMCLACNIMPMRPLPDPKTMHHCICENCFKAGITCPYCRLGQSSWTAQEQSALPPHEANLQRAVRRYLGMFSSSSVQTSSWAPPVTDVQPAAAVAPETLNLGLGPQQPQQIFKCWDCNSRVAPWVTYYPTVPEHLCVCLTCFDNGSTACPLCRGDPVPCHGR